MDSHLTALAIAPEGEWEYLAPLHAISGLSLHTCAHLRENQAQQSQLIILLASNCSTINHWLNQIRGQLALSLLPVLIIAPDDPNPYQALADETVHLPLSPAQLEPPLNRLLKVYQQVNTFPSLARQLTPQEGQLTNLLRYLMSRGAKPLLPHRFLDSRLGYAHPLVAAFLNTPLGEEMPYLQELELLGLLKGQGFDRLHLCPACGHYQLNFREVCPKCQVPHINREDNIHHYSCATIAPENEFLKTDQLICPKCCKSLRHIGVDYNKPSASYKCQRCQSLFPEALVNCLCIHCGNSFSPEQAHLAEIKEYHLTLAGMQAAQTGVIQKAPEPLATCSTQEIVSYSAFEELFRVQLWISKRLHHSFCLIALEVDETEDCLQHLLRKNLRQSDLISQLTQGQFLILSPETDREKAELAMQRITNRMMEQLSTHSVAHSVGKQPGFKVAIAQLPQDGEDLKQLTAKLLG